MNRNDTFFHVLPPPWNTLLPHLATIVVWGIFFSLIYLLRSFFLLFFLTFVFSYIQERSVNRLEPYIKIRAMRVCIIALIFLSILTTVGIFLVPKVKKQTEFFASQFTVYVNRVDLELFKLEKKYPILTEILPELATKEEMAITDGNVERKKLKNSPAASLITQFLGFGETASGLQNVNQLVETLGNIGGRIASVTSTFFLSLLFSFLIVLDLPSLGHKVRQLESTKLGFIYSSVAGNILEFSQVLGRALEAQLIIATINSFLTALGITILGLGSQVAFLSVIVFFCSFFPVIGVFISSIPICLVALQTAGPHTMIMAILLITAIHLVEGYILNPRIYGSYMRINAVIILIILTIGAKLFSVWGLILGVPVCTYIFGHAIRSEPQQPGRQQSEEN